MNYERELDLLRLKLNEMFSLSIEAFKFSIISLEDSNVDMARSIVDGDDEIDDIKRIIENMAYKILETFCPKGINLRRVVMVIKIANELERIADQAVNIAQVTEFMNGRKLVKPLVDIPKMAQISQDMVRSSMRAYFEEDVELAKKVWLTDEKVDQLDKKVIEDLKNVVIKDSNVEVVSQVERLILVSRAIERVADHATNICEESVYMVLGKELYEILKG